MNLFKRSKKPEITVQAIKITDAMISGSMKGTAMDEKDLEKTLKLLAKNISEIKYQTFLVGQVVINCQKEIELLNRKLNEPKNDRHSKANAGNGKGLFGRFFTGD